MWDGANEAPTTLRDLVLGLRNHGDRPAVMAVSGDGASTVTYRDLADRALRLATGLADAGVRPGEPVLLFGPNSQDWIVVRLALAALGALAVAFDDLLTDEELAVLVPDSGARRAFAAAGHVPRLRALPAGRDMTIHALDDAGDGSNEGAVPHWSALLAEAPEALPPIAADDPHMLVYTSGTTGRPKSFLLTHANNLHNIRGLMTQRIVGADDHVLLPLPLHHVYPLTVGLLTALATGSLLVLPEAVDGPRLVRAMQLGQVTVMVGVPRLYAAMLSGLQGRIAARGRVTRQLFALLFALSLWSRQRLGLRLGKTLFGSLHRQLSPDLWLLASGGARFEAELIWRLEALGWDVRSGWGLAETASILTNNGGGDNKRIGSEGRPLPGMQVRVADPDADGVGELQALGPSLFTGYVGNAEANAVSFSEDGWFRTGDLGRIDADGFVYIAGRVKEMIVLGGGKNVFPEELEKVYGASPFIAELAVLEENGALVALVRPDQPAITAAGYLRVDDVIRVALTEKAPHLAPYQRLVGFAVSQEPLPRNRLGKYQRFLLPDLYRRARAGEARPAAALSPEDQAWLASPPVRPVWDWLRERYPDKPLHPDTSLQLDLGVDSLEWVTITLELGERLDIHLTEEDGAEVFTLRDLLRLAEQRRGAGAAIADASAEAAGRLPPLTPEQRAWLAPRGPALRALGMLLYALDRVAARLLFRLRVRGDQHVPTAGPLIVAFNHTSDLDPPLVGAALGLRRLGRSWWSGDARRIFGSRIGRLAARAARVFPVDERNPASSLTFGREILDRGDILIWFPEAWRSPTGELQRFLPGIGHLVRQTGATVVPGRLFGTFEAWPRTRRWPRPHRVSIVFGPPLAADALLEGEADPAKIADRVRDAVAGLAAEPSSAPHLAPTSPGPRADAMDGTADQTTRKAG